MSEIHHNCWGESGSWVIEIESWLGTNTKATKAHFALVKVFHPTRQFRILKFAIKPLMKFKVFEEKLLLKF